MKVKYAEGSVALAVPVVGRVERGETVEVPDEMGRQLVNQGWQEIKPASSSPATAATKPKKED